MSIFRVRAEGMITSIPASAASCRKALLDFADSTARMSFVDRQITAQKASLDALQQKVTAGAMSNAELFRRQSQLEELQQPLSSIAPFMLRISPSRIRIRRGSLWGDGQHDFETVGAACR